jgi:hypothetical protein
MHELELREPNNAHWRFAPPFVIETWSVVSEIQKAEGHNPVPFAEKTRNNLNVLLTVHHSISV